MKMQWCSDWIHCLLNKLEPTLLKHNASIWILLKIQASFMLCVRYIFFFMCEYKYYSHDVDWMYPCDIETFDVFLCCCSTNERLGVSGFQVLVRWERRWVTGLMNSDGRQLLINQETVCQPADWKSSPSPMFTHIFAHKHIPIWKYTHICAILWRFGEQHEHTHRHPHSSYPLHLDPLCLLSSGGQSCLSPWQHEHRVLLPVRTYHSHWGKTLAEYGKIF